MTYFSSRRSFVALLLSATGLAATVLAGDGCADSTTVPPVISIAREDLCAELADAVCDLVDRCACGAPAMAACRAEYASECALELIGPELEASIAAGRVTYSSLAAGRVVANLRSEPPSCGDPVETMGFRVRDILTFGGVIEGTLPVGATCIDPGGSFPNDCLLGYCEGGVCVPAVGLGDSCGPATECLDLDAPFADLFSPWAQAYCSISPGELTGVCQARLPGGAVCTSHDDCATGVCTAGGCASPLARGAACDADAQCATHRCGYESLCVAGDAADGAACTFNYECASHECRAGICMSQLCARYTAEVPVP